MAVPALIFILILIPYLAVDMAEPEKGIEIDGNFRDWKDVIKTSDVGEALPFNSNVDIVDCGVDGKLQELSFYIKVYGRMLYGEPAISGKHVDSAFIFIDADRSQKTGYIINGLGADYMIKIEGWQNEVYSQNLYSCTSKTFDWNQWKWTGGVSTAVSGSELEVQVAYSALYLNNHDAVDVLFYMQSWDRYEDFSDTIISNEKGVLLVDQQGVGEGYITSLANKILRLDIRAQNDDINIDEIKLTRTGVGSDVDVASVRLIDGPNTLATGILSKDTVTFQTSISLKNKEIRTLYVEVDIGSGAWPEHSIGFEIAEPHDIGIQKGAITLRNLQPNQYLYDISYINSIPQEIKVDGAFADWESREIRKDRAGDSENENLDIIEYGVTNSTSTVSFYLKVDGEIGWGAPVPHINDAVATTPIEPPGPGEPGPPHIEPPIPPVAPSENGEDITYIYIDSDNDSASGYLIGGIGADHLLEIKGKYGEIVSRKHMSFGGSIPIEWKWVDVGEVDAETDTAILEAQMSKIYLEIAGPFKVYFQTSDWSESDFDHSSDEISRHSRHSEGLDSTLSASLPRGTRTWPSSWISVTTDSDDTLADESNDILELYYYEDGSYFYFRLRVDVNTAPTLQDNSWGVYIDDNGEGNNDYLVQENWTDMVGYWDWGGSDWDWNQAELTSDIARVTTMDVGGTTYGVIDIHVSKTILPSLDYDDYVTAFAHPDENATRDADAVRNPTDATPTPNDDVTGPSTIPEFEDIIIPSFCMMALFMVIKNRNRKKRKIKKINKR
jgi:hypothetical protein